MSYPLLLILNKRQMRHMVARTSKNNYNKPYGAVVCDNPVSRSFS